VINIPRYNVWSYRKCESKHSRGINFEMKNPLIKLIFPGAVFGDLRSVRKNTPGELILIPCRIVNR